MRRHDNGFARRREAREEYAGSGSRGLRMLRVFVINRPLVITMNDLAEWRGEFPILARTVYMISNSLGAMPRQTARNLADYAEAWATRGVRAWEERWWEKPVEVCDRVSRIIGAPLRSVSMHENVTSAHMTALSTVRPVAARKRIVCA